MIKCPTLQCYSDAENKNKNKKIELEKVCLKNSDAGRVF
jgi:hypothetical protein